MTYTHLVHVAKAYRITADIVVSTLYFYQVYLFAYTGERLTFRVRVMAFAAMLRQVRVASNQVITLLLFFDVPLTQNCFSRGHVSFFSYGHVSFLSRDHVSFFSRGHVSMVYIVSGGGLV